MPSSKKKSNGLLEKLVPVLLVLSIILAFAVGMLWQKVTNLESGGTNKGTNTADQGNTAGQAPQPVNGKLTDEQAKNIPEVTSEDHVNGSRNAEVFLIEYSDLECPFCKQFQQTAQQAVDEYDGQVAWVFRHFPLDLLHSKARTEALASECAFAQGGNDGFWKFIDKVYEVTPSNNGLNLDDLPKLADQVGLDGSSLQTCIDGEKYKDIVENDYQGGVSAGVSGTPGNFVMNSKGEVWSIPGAVPYSTLKTTIDEALQG